MIVRQQPPGAVRDDQVREFKDVVPAVPARKADKGIHAQCVKYLPQMEELPRRCRLPLIDMALPSLRELSFKQYEQFSANVSELIAADAKLDLFEWCLQKILLKHLDEAFFQAKTPSGRYSSLDKVSETLLDALGFEQRLHIQGDVDGFIDAFGNCLESLTGTEADDHHRANLRPEERREGAQPMGDLIGQSHDV